MYSKKSVNRSGGIMREFGVVVCFAVSLAGCTTSSGVSPQIARAQKQHEQKMAECEARDFKRAMDNARCMNSADQIALSVAGGDADLYRYRMAKRVEIAQRLDAGKISLAKANSELTAVYSQTASELNQRRSQRVAAAAQFMAAQNQADAMQSIARSQSRMANAMEDANSLSYPDAYNNPFEMVKRNNRY